jgi:hypothetical protein
MSSEDLIRLDTTKFDILTPVAAIAPSAITSIGTEETPVCGTDAAIETGPLNKEEEEEEEEGKKGSGKLPTGLLIDDDDDGRKITVSSSIGGPTIIEELEELEGRPAGIEIIGESVLTINPRERGCFF